MVRIAQKVTKFKEEVKQLYDEPNIMKKINAREQWTMIRNLDVGC
jgi:hypothetical protein